jgi:uncharacterized protein YutE (UPF0331/DUF86 family)
MAERIKEKMEEIQNYVDELLVFMPKEFQQYKDDAKTRAACERYFEKIIEAATDLAFLLIKDKNLKIPEEDKEAFDVLSAAKIMSDALAARLKDAKGMRNILAHQYGKVDDEIVFRSITEELVRDVSEFSSSAKKTLKKPPVQRNRQSDRQ